MSVLCLFVVWNQLRDASTTSVRRSSLIIKSINHTGSSNQNMILPSAYPFNKPKQLRETGSASQCFLIINSRDQLNSVIHQQHLRVGSNRPNQLKKQATESASRYSFIMCLQLQNIALKIGLNLCAKPPPSVCCRPKYAWQFGTLSWLLLFVYHFDAAKQ